MTSYTFEEITKSKPEKALVKPLRKSAGRNARDFTAERHRRRKDDSRGFVLSLLPAPGRTQGAAARRRTHQTAQADPLLQRR